jgi:V/A-type H+/Na+-transporting ATPase subunit K
MKLKEMIIGLLVLNVVIALAIGMYIFFVPTSSYGFQTNATAPTTTGTTPAPATGGSPATDTGNAGTERGWGYIAAALSTGIAALGAGVAVSGVGSAAMGAISERPELLGRSLIFVGLAEGIAIYGLIISIMILGRLG